MTNRDSLVVSVVQFTASDLDPDGTVKKCLALIDKAAADGAQLVVLPEVWTGLGYSSPTAAKDLAQTVPGPATDALAERARRHGLYIVGSLYGHAPSGRLYNVAPVIGPDGAVLGRYVKTHLFDAPNRADIMGGIRESAKVDAGHELPVFSTELGPIGVTICSDLRFPEPYRLLALRGARIILNVSAFLAPRVDHWEFLLRARAVENQVFVVGSGQVGIEPASGIGFVGRSMIVDPWGTVIATASDTEGIVTSRIDMSLIDQVRRSYPLLEQRRPSLYGDITAAVNDQGLLASGPAVPTNA